MSNDKFWKKMQKLLDQLEEKIEEENQNTRSSVASAWKRLENEQSAQASKLREIADSVNTAPTWDRLMENEDFQELSEKSQKVIWELVKIEEGDSPKTQSEVAEQYGIDRSRVSQLKKKTEGIDLD